MKTLLKKGLFWLAVAAPAALAFGFLVRFGVDVPFWDEWGSTGHYLLKQLDGPLTFADYFNQHNESRMPVSRFVVITTSGISGWHPKGFMFFTWALVCVFCLLFMRLFLEPLSTLGYLGIVVAGLVCVLLFSPVQYENFLWGFQFALFIPGICLLVNMLVLRRAWTYRRKVLVCAAINCFATYSFANGLLCWVLCLPLIPVILFEWPAVLKRQRREMLIWTVVYILLGAVTLGLYFYRYEQPGYHPPLSYVLRHPTVGINYFLIWIGAPWVAFYESEDSRLLAGRIIGLIVLTICLGAVALFVTTWLHNRRAAWLAAAYPAFCIISYGLASDVMATAGRAGFGLEQALSSRYATFSLSLLVGILAFLYVFVRQQTDTRQGWMWRQAVVFFLGMVTVLGLLNVYAGYNIMRHISDQNRQNHLTVRLLPVAADNPLLTGLYPDPVFVANTAPRLMEAGILPIRPMGGWLADQARKPDGDALGQYQAVVSGGALQMSGWAVLPGARRPADFVLVCRTDTAGAVTNVVSGLVLAGRDGDIAAKYHNKRLEVCRFSASLDMKADSSFRGQYTVLAVDTLQQKVYRLARIEE